MLPASAGGQDVHGVVRDAASGLPIAGVILQLVDSSGRQVTRRITGAQGEYRVPLYGPYIAIEARRIGFRPARHAVPRSPGDMRIDVVLHRVPTMLAGITVRDQPSCPSRRDRASAFALWEQAKSGLMAADAGAEAQPADLKVLEFQRWLDPASERITEQHVRVTHKRASVSFVAAASAPDFIARGFLVSGGYQRMFYAPDAQVLLDNRFTQGYCFGLAARERARPQQVGLTFTPARQSPGVVGVEGTLWIDTVARRLVDMEYSYLTELPRPRPASGGFLSFLDLENGVTLIDRWHIRMVQSIGPSVAQIPTSSSTMERVGNAGASAPTVRLSEAGGELASASWPSGPHWRGSLGRIRSPLIDREGRAVPGQLLRLRNTDYVATSDSTGIVELEDLVPGPYVAELMDSALARIGVPMSTTVRITIDRGATWTQPIESPSAASYVASLCREDGVFERGSRMLIARVYRADGVAVSRARWDLEGHTGITGDDGILVFCRGLQRRDRVVVRILAGERYLDFPIRLDQAVTVARITLP